MILKQSEVNMNLSQPSRNRLCSFNREIFVFPERKFLTKKLPPLIFPFQITCFRRNGYFSSNVTLSYVKLE